MVAPTVTTRIDWANKGAFTGAFDTVSPMEGIAISRGASADFASEAVGEMRFELDNVGHRYTPDRNWIDNPSFEVDTSGWLTSPVAGVSVAATSITQVTDNAGQGGTKAGEVVTTATTFSGVNFPFPYAFRAGVAYTFRVWLKSVSGTTSVILWAGRSGDSNFSDLTITTSWAAYSVTWTPSANRTDVVLLLATRVAAAATFRVDAIQANPGSSANAYIEAPTKGQLVPGRPVHCYATNGGVDTAKFYGYIHQLTPDPANERVSVTCRDVLQKMAETDVVVPASTYVERSAREMRLAVLEDFERGTRNLLHNPSFETSTTGWTFTGTSLTRTAGDAAPGAGSACAEWVAAAANNRATIPVRLAPLFFDGQVYRGSIYLRTTSGTSQWAVGLGIDTATNFTERVVTATTTWTRFSVAFEMPSTQQSQLFPLMLIVRSLGAGTVRLDAAMVTRGEPLYTYADAGAGRWPNWVGNGGFEGGVANAHLGWIDLWKNLVSNPSFEVNATGWTNVTRDLTGAYVGTAQGAIAGAATATFNLTGTFKAGVTYDLVFRGQTQAGTALVTYYLGSAGTAGDRGTVLNQSWSNVYAARAVSWTPSADRTDAQVSINSASALFIDAVVVAVRVSGSGAITDYEATGPGGGGVSPTSIGVVVGGGSAKYGYRHATAATPATAGAGRAYDFNHLAPFFPGAVQFVATIWLRPNSSMPYKVGIGANAGDGTWDEATTTGTLTANVWTQVTLAWTPSADRNAWFAQRAVFWWMQTDATARQVDYDGARVIPGSTADEYEMARWSIPAQSGEATDLYASTAGLAGSALSALSSLNRLTLTRHWIRPTMASPFYTYVTQDRDTFAAKSVVATFSEDVQGWESLDLDKEAIVNVVGVTWNGGGEIYSDEASVAAFGPQPGGDIDGSSFFPDRTIPDVVGAALVRRYSFPRQRPRLQIEQQYANQLALDLNDLLAVSIERFLLRSRRFVILREDLVISQGGRSWVTVYATEEYP